MTVEYGSPRNKKAGITVRDKVVRLLLSCNAVIYLYVHQFWSMHRNINLTINKH